jgi:tetratricopeptide (TPR) repeat protein
MEADNQLEHLLDEALEALDSGRNEQARKFASQAVEKAPDDPEAWEYLGTALWRLGDLEKAAEAFLHWRDLSPLSRAAHRSLVNTLFRLRRYDEVEEACRQMVAKWPEDPYCLVLMANVCYKRGEPFEPLLEKAISKAPAAARTMLVELFDFTRADVEESDKLSAEDAARLVGVPVEYLLRLAENKRVPHRRVPLGEREGSYSFVFYASELTAWKNTLSRYASFPPPIEPTSRE